MTDVEGTEFWVYSTIIAAPVGDVYSASRPFNNIQYTWTSVDSPMKIRESQMDKNFCSHLECDQ